MTGKELRRLSRRDLLELLFQEHLKNEELQTRIAALEKERNDQLINTEKVGSLTEAALVLNGIFADADKGTMQYRENTQSGIEEQDIACDRIILAAEQQAREMISTSDNERCKKIEEIDSYRQQLSQSLEQFYQSYAGLKELLVTITQKMSGNR